MPSPATERPRGSRFQQARCRLVGILALRTSDRSVLFIERNVPVSLIVRVETERARRRSVMVCSIIRLDVLREEDLGCWTAFRRAIKVLARQPADGVSASSVLFMAQAVEIV